MDLKICAKKTCNRSGFALKISSKSDHFSKIYGTSKSVHFHFDLTVRFRSELCDNYFCFCDTHFRDLERRKFIIFSLWVTWVLSFTYTKPCQIQRPFCVFTTENDFCEVFEKNCSCHQSFHQKRFSTKKTFLWKNLSKLA